MGETLICCHKIGLDPSWDFKNMTYFFIEYFIDSKKNRLMESI